MITKKLENLEVSSICICHSSIKSSISEMPNNRRQSYSSDEDNDTDNVSKTLPDLNVKSKNVFSILTEAGLSDNAQKKLKELFSKLKSEFEKDDGSEAVKFKLSVQLLDEIINHGTLGSKTVNQLLELLVIENLQATSLVNLLRKCIEEIKKNTSETFDFWLSVIGRVLSTIQIVETFKLNEDDGGVTVVSAKDFVSETVREICGMNWNCEMAASMCSMLKVNLNDIIWSCLMLSLIFYSVAESEFHG